MVPHRAARAFTFALVFLALTPRARAEGSWPVPRGPSREPVPYRYDAKLLKTIPKPFLEDAAACVLYSGNNHLVEADGTIENVNHEVTRLNGRKGVEKLGEYRNIAYNPGHQKLTLNEARVHKPDGRVLDVQPRHVQLRDATTDYQSYDPDKQLIISFPNLEVGDVVEVKWTLRGKNPEHAGQFFNRYSFGDPSYPVVLDEMRVRIPKSKTLKYACCAGKIEPTISETADARTYHWKATNTARSPQDENLPAKDELRPSVVCSTFASWEQVGAWKARLRADCWKCTAEITKLVKEVTAGLTTPAVKARALTYWVRRHVRYVSMGERHDYTPYAPAKVLANRFGDCKDTSQLLAVMLREAGIAVELATLGTYDDGQVLENVPSPWGTHAILLATIDGKPHWIDTTVRLAGWDFLPHDDRDRLCYLTDEKGKIRLLRTPALRPKDNRFEQTTEVWVGSDGSARCRRSIVARGSAALGQRDRFVEVPPGERRRQVTAELQDANSRTRLVRLLVDEPALQDYDRPVSARYDYEVPRLFSGAGDREGNVADSKVWGKLLSITLDHDRKAPLVFHSPFESTHRYVLHVAPSYRLEEVPGNVSIGSTWGSFTLKARALNKGPVVRDLELTFHTRLEKPRIEPEDFEEFRQFHEDVGRRYRVWLTIKPTTDIASAPLLEAVLAFDPQDNISAATLARLYQSAGREADARRVLERARRYRPEDPVLWELSVKCADGVAQEEAAQREVARRFPRNPKYKLDLGAVLVNRGKQAEARKVLEPLTRKGPAALRAQAHFHLARSHYRLDELKPALQHMEEATRADADAVHSVRAYLLKARILEELGRPAEAARAYKEVLTVDRESEEALLCLIRLSLAARQRADALTHLRRYTLLVGSDFSGLLLAADAYLQLGRYDDAFDLAWRARDQGFSERCQRILGMVYLHRQDFARAVHHLEKAEPSSDVLVALLRAYTMLGNLREMEARLEKATLIEKPSAALTRACENARRLLKRRADLAGWAAVPADKAADWGPALDALACAAELHTAGQPAARVSALLERCFADGRKIGPAFALRGRLALDRGKLSLAQADGEQAVRLSPQDPQGFYVRGRVRLERNSLGALADLEKAAELCGRKDAVVLHALAEAQFRADRLEAALDTQRAAVKLRPKDKEIAEQLDTLEKAARSRGKAK
jgi:tetratricopeptide (TPR) repeat protein